MGNTNYFRGVDDTTTVKTAQRSRKGKILKTVRRRNQEENSQLGKIHRGR